MATSVEELLNMLFDMVDEARNAPLSSEKCVIERDKALDLIEDAKAQLAKAAAKAEKAAAAKPEDAKLADAAARAKKAADDAAAGVAFPEKDTKALYEYFCRELDRALTETAESLDENLTEDRLPALALGLALRSYADKLACQRVLDIIQMKSPQTEREVKGKEKSKK